MLCIDPRARKSVLRCRGHLHTDGCRRKVGSAHSGIARIGLAKDRTCVLEDIAHNLDLRRRIVRRGTQVDIGFAQGKSVLRARGIDKGDLETEVLSDRTGKIGLVAADAAVLIRHGLGSVGGVEGNGEFAFCHKGGRGDVGLGNRALGVLAQRRREQRASAQTEGRRQGKRHHGCKGHLPYAQHRILHSPKQGVYFRSAHARVIYVASPQLTWFLTPHLRTGAFAHAAAAALTTNPLAREATIASQKERRTVRLTSRTRHDRAARTRTLTWIPLTASVLD